MSPRRSRLRFLRSRTIRNRLTRVLLVSLILILGLLSSIVAGQVRNYFDAIDMVDTPALAMSEGQLVHQLQLERGVTNGAMVGDNRFQQMMLDQRVSTDRAVAALGQTVENSNVAGARAVRGALNTLTAGLTQQRNDIDAHRADRTQTFQYFTERIAAFNSIQFGLAESPGADQAHDPLLRREWKALAATNAATEMTAQEAAFMVGVFSQDHLQLGDYIRFIGIKAKKEQAFLIAGVSYSPTDIAAWRAVMAGPDAVDVGIAENVASAFAQNSLGHRIDPLTWWNQTSGLMDEEHSIRQLVGSDVHTRAQAVQRDAELQLGVYIVGALLIAAIEVFLVLGSMRSIIRPLAALQREADDVASTRLPEAVSAWHTQAEPAPPQPVRTSAVAGAEIASVADALDRVQSTAFELAAEQAQLRKNTTESLANLGRRNQNLVRRLLGFISELEKEELDPSALSNLFELDHLATRMRRNAESLLVLVGEISPRPWAEPIPLGDIIRAGLSEVEAYRRVVLRRVDEAFVVGSAAGELAHMLAELIENGLAFSPPDLEVEIYGRRTSVGYSLAVVDHGIGMSKEELATANARLSGEEQYLVAPTRFLGHFVVGRLAERLGIQVELTVSPVGGIAARLALPDELIVDRKALPAGSQAEWQEVTGYSTGPQEPTGPTIAVAHTEPIEAETTPVPAEPAPAAPRPEPVRPPVVAAFGAAPIDATVVEPSRPQPGEVQLTRNGLVKRRPSPAGSTVTGTIPSLRVPAPPASPFTPPVYPEPITERSPEEVRSMLSQFRSGHQRGQHASEPGDAAGMAATSATAVRPHDTEEETR